MVQHNPNASLTAHNKNELTLDGDISLQLESITINNEPCTFVNNNGSLTVTLEQQHYNYDQLLPFQIVCLFKIMSNFIYLICLIC